MVTTNGTGMNEAGSDHSGLSIAYLGTVVPDKPEFITPAFSRAGNLYQENFLAGLAELGSPPDVVVSARLLPSVPASRELVVPGGAAVLQCGIGVTFVPYINVTPLKQVTIGLGALVLLIRWAFRSRGKNRIIYTYNLSVPPGLFALIAARLCGAKLVAALCDINVPGETVPAGLWQRLDYWVQRRLIPRLDGVVPIVDAMVRDFAPASPFLRLDGGVTSRTLAVPVMERDERECVIAFAGTLNRANGVEVLLDGFQALSGAEYRLRIAGSGPLEAKVRELARADQRVEYLGAVSHSEVLALYSAADLLVSLRLTKAVNTRYFFPSKILEYLCTGVPVLTTATGHLEQEYGDFVYLLREETAAGFVDAVHGIHQQSVHARRERAARGREYVATSKTWKAQSARVLEFLVSLVSASKSGNGAGTLRNG